MGRCLVLQGNIDASEYKPVVLSLMFFNNVILPFADDFPKDTELYKLLTTKPSEVAHETVDDEKEDQNG